MLNTISADASEGVCPPMNVERADNVPAPRLLMRSVTRQSNQTMLMVSVGGTTARLGYAE
jgi:hypothetical protein